MIMSPTRPPLLRRATSEWLLLDNDGSYGGHFDFMPKRLRVGAPSPIAFVFVALCAGLILYSDPATSRSLAPRIEPLTSDFWLDAGIFAFGALVLVHVVRIGWASVFFVSYTGWSWTLLTTRALCAAGRSALPLPPATAAALAAAEAYLRFPVLCGAVITFCVWNLVLAPLMYAFMPAKERRSFIKFNFQPVLLAVHVANLPMGLVHTVWLTGARPFATADLWAALHILLVYAIMYLCVLDRLGIHLYGPVFSPRHPLCVSPYSALLGLYAGIFYAWNRVLM